MGVEPREPNGRQAAGTADDPLHVTRDAQEVPLGLLVRLVGLSFLGYVVVTLLVAGYMWNRQDNQRFEDQQDFAQQLATQNERLIQAVDTKLSSQDRKIKTAIAGLCADAELRDTVIADQNRAIVALLKTVPPPVPPKVQALIDTSQDGISTLEPSNEKDCPLPPETP